MTSTGSGTKSENSVQFSLSELMKLEVERVEEEERAKKAREEAAFRAAKEAREAEERARLAEEAAKREQARAEEAKRDAMKSAAVEQARIEVEAHARAMERERERRHELELATQRALTKAATPSIGMVFGSTMFGGLLMLIVVLAVHLGVSKPAADRHVADLEGRIAVAEKRAEDSSHRADDLRSKVVTLESERNDARTEIERLKAALAAKPGKKDAVQTPAPVPPKPTVKEKEKEKEPPCDPKDPMCFALPRAG